MAQKDCVKSHARKEAFILPQTCPEIWRISNFDRHAPEAGHYGVFLHPIPPLRCMGSNNEKKAKHFPGASLGPWGKSARNPALGVDLSKIQRLMRMGARANDDHTMRVRVVLALQISKQLACKKKNCCGPEHQTEIVYGPAYRIVRQLSFLAHPSDFEDENLNSQE